MNILRKSYCNEGTVFQIKKICYCYIENFSQFTSSQILKLKKKSTHSFEFIILNFNSLLLTKTIFSLSVHNEIIVFTLNFTHLTNIPIAKKRVFFSFRRKVFLLIHIIYFNTSVNGRPRAVGKNCAFYLKFEKLILINYLFIIYSLAQFI